MENILPSKCAPQVWQTITNFLSGSTTWNHSIRHAQPLYICSDFYRWGRFMHLTTVKLSFSAYLLFVISCFINAILHVEVVEREILHSATSGPINSIGVRANTADALEDCNFFFFSILLVGQWFHGQHSHSKARGEQQKWIPRCQWDEGYISGCRINLNQPHAFQKWALFSYMCQ